MLTRRSVELARAVFYAGKGGARTVASETGLSYVTVQKHHRRVLEAIDYMPDRPSEPDLPFDAELSEWDAAWLGYRARVREFRAAQLDALLLSSEPSPACPCCKRPMPQLSEPNQ